MWFQHNLFFNPSGQIIAFIPKHFTLIKNFHQKFIRMDPDRIIFFENDALISIVLNEVVFSDLLNHLLIILCTSNLYCISLRKMHSFRENFNNFFFSFFTFIVSVYSHQKCTKFCFLYTPSIMHSNSLVDYRNLETLKLR